MALKDRQELVRVVRESYNLESYNEVRNAFKQAVQDAPEALDRQRIPEDARDIAGGYFRRLGNQK